MLHLYKDLGESRETVDHVMPGAAGCYGEAVQDAGRLILFGCFDNDLGGEVRVIDKDYYDGVPDRTAIAEDFLEHTELLHTISFCGKTELKITSEPSGMLVAHHVPGHYN
jgi:hypothetical protein